MEAYDRIYPRMVQEMQEAAGDEEPFDLRIEF
jgi:hypothetical protein